MYRHGKLVCSVSSEVEYCIELYLKNLGLSHSEAVALSHKYSNVNEAIKNSSLNSLLPIHSEFIEPAPIVSEAIKENPSNSVLDSEILPSNKLEMKQKLKKLGINPESIEILINSCDTIEEALANTNSEELIENFQLKNIKKDNQFVCDNKNTTTNDFCPICLNRYKIGEKIRILDCMHKAHNKCIRNWFKYRKACPICLNNE